MENEEKSINVWIKRLSRSTRRFERRWEKFLVGNIPANCGLPRFHLREVKRRMRQEFNLRGGLAIVPQVVVEQIITEVSVSRFADALVEKEILDIPF